MLRSRSNETIDFGLPSADVYLYRSPNRWEDWWPERNDGLFEEWSFIFPLWIPLAACGVPATVLWLRYWRRKRDGMCSKCGYDLRGIADRCPECGTAIQNNVRTTTPT